MRHRNFLPVHQVVLSAGEDQYQTVTIVPNDSTTGEVSYVLIVQQGEGEKKEGEEELEGVYDFEGGEEEFDEEELGEDKPGVRLLKRPHGADRVGA